MTEQSSAAYGQRPVWMQEPEYVRELEAEEWDRQAAEWEAVVFHAENVRLGFDEDAA